nr:hypothetical protein Iba_chr13eCG8700 [Ipomoea batatas]
MVILIIICLIRFGNLFSRFFLFCDWVSPDFGACRSPSHDYTSPSSALTPSCRCSSLPNAAAGRPAPRRCCSPGSTPLGARRWSPLHPATLG